MLSLEAHVLTAQPPTKPSKSSPSRGLGLARPRGFVSRSDMATWLARIIVTSPKSSSLIQRSSAVVGLGGSMPRSASSSSSSSSSSPSSSSSNKSPKAEKKLVDRLSAVIDAVNDRKLPPELRGQRNSVRSETDIINVVEQRIWHSMEEGQFENLPGKGKPLNLSTNPHADPAEDTLYRILSKNGCAPEWVELNKEIRSQISEWRSTLKKAWANRCNGDHSTWIESSEALKAQLRDINNKVSHYAPSGVCESQSLRERGSGSDTENSTRNRRPTSSSTQVFRYNLIVPFGRQMFGLKWEKEMDRVKE